MIGSPIVSIVLSALLSFALPASAAVTPFTATHTYVLGDDDSRNSARQKCLAEAKRKILEQVGVYLESHSELLTSSQSTTAGSAKSPQTTNEERQQITEKIITLSAGLMRAEVIKEEFGEVNGRLQITLTLKADVDPDDIQKQLAALRVDQGVRKQVTEQTQRLAQLEEQLRIMMEEMRIVGGSQPRGSEKQGKRPVVPDVAEIRARASRGDAEAQSALGVMYQLGRGVPRSDTEAVAWYRKAAAQGDAYAQSNLGVMYAFGHGVPQNDMEAVAWLRKAATQGQAVAQYNLGVMSEEGRGVPQSDTEAVAWYHKAAAQGDARAQNNLGMMSGEGRGMPQSDTEAVAWFRKAADQGFAVPHNLGVAYYKGKGVPQDKAQANAWFLKAAEQRYSEGQNALAGMYLEGRDVPQDHVKARQWYEQAAAQGNAAAQNDLGYLYLDGKGVRKDEKKGVEWIRKAAEQGNANGQDSLGEMYRDGRGVPQDNVRAYMWFDLAVQQYLRQGGKGIETAQHRDAMAKQLTNAQIAEAQRLAQQCRASNYKNCD